MPRSYSVGLFDAVQGLSSAAAPVPASAVAAVVANPVGEFVRGSKRRTRRRVDSREESDAAEYQEHLAKIVGNPLLRVGAGLAESEVAPNGTTRPAPQAPLDNMVLQTLHRQLLTITPEVQVVCGVDKMEVLFYGDIVDSGASSADCPEGAACWFDRCQAARVVNSEKAFSAPVEFVGATVFPVNGHAVHRGGRMMYPYQFEWNGMRFALGNPAWQPTDLGRDSFGCKTQYRLLGKVIFDSTALTTWGASVLLCRAQWMFARLGLHIRDSRVSVLHLRFDLVGCPTHPLVWLIDAEWRRTVWKKDAEWKPWGPVSARESITCGKSSDIRLNLYDKMAEFRRRDETCSERERKELDLKWEAAVADWGCIPSYVTRLEFQFSGNWMRRRFSDCKRVEDVLSRLRSMADVLLSEQLVLLAQQPDRANNHQGRCEVHPLWAAVQKANADRDWREASVDGLPEAALVKIKRAVSARCVRRLISDTERIAERWIELLPAEVIENWGGMESLGKVGAAAFIMSANGDSHRALDGALRRRASSRAKAISPFLEAVQLPIDRCRGMFIDVGYEASSVEDNPSFFSLLVSNESVPF